MGKGIILYQSKYGATKKYAELLQDKTGYDCVETKKASITQLHDYDTIVLGGGVYASGISGLSFLKKHIEGLSDKKIAVFAVGASPYDENAIGQIRTMHFTGPLGQIPLYYCRGAWNESVMSFGDRTLCKMLQKAVSKQDPSTFEPWQKALLEAMGQKCDWTDPAYLEPLLTFLEN